MLEAPSLTAGVLGGGFPAGTKVDGGAFGGAFAGTFLSKNTETGWCNPQGHQPTH